MGQMLQATLDAAVGLTSDTDVYFTEATRILKSTNTNWNWNPSTVVGGLSGATGIALSGSSVYFGVSNGLKVYNGGTSDVTNTGAAIA
jgi:hypothetical protein